MSQCFQFSIGNYYIPIYDRYTIEIDEMDVDISVFICDHLPWTCSAVIGRNSPTYEVT